MSGGIPGDGVGAGYDRRGTTSDSVALPHRLPDCPGTWRREHRAWRCSACWAVVYRCTETDVAAEREEEMGELLRELTHEGRGRTT